MHVIVVGCGRVGSELAMRLCTEGHSTVVMDKNRASFRRLPSSFSGRTVEGLGFDKEHLEEAGIKTADALAAVTSGDNSNILTARIAKENFEVPKVVARIYDPRRAEIYQRLGISTVATVTWTTEQAMRKIFSGTALPDWTDPNGQFVLLERGIPTQMSGKHLRFIEEIPGVKPILITRGNQSKLFRSDTVAHEGDVLHVMVLKSAIDQLDGLLAESKN